MKAMAFVLACVFVLAAGGSVMEAYVRRDAWQAVSACGCGFLAFMIFYNLFRKREA